MLIKVHGKSNKLVMYVEHSLIASIDSPADMTLGSIVWTTVQTPKGPVILNVVESPSEIAQAVNMAYVGMNPLREAMQ